MSDGESPPNAVGPPDSAHTGNESGWTLFIGLQIAGVIGTAVAMFVGIAMLIPSVFYGIVLGQLTLAAMGAALGPWPLSKRLLLPPVWTAVMFLVLQGPLFSVLVPFHIYFFVMLLAIGAMFLLQVPFWAIRWLARVRARYLSSLDDSSEAASNQFGIRGLLVLTLVVAIVLGLCRAIVPRDVFVDFAATPAEQWLLPLTLLALAAACGVASVLSALGMGDVVLPIGVATVCVILLLFALLAIGESIGLRGNDLLEVPLGLFAHFIWTTGSLLAVRRTGLRIARVDR